MLPEQELPDFRISRDLLFAFFVRFSRFEYALKAGGYLLSGKQDGVRPNWDAFTSDLEQGDPSRLPGLLQTGRYLLDYPPRLQVQRAGRLGWKDVVRRPDESELTYLIRAVRRVRNNLFHGGKFSDGSIENPHRNARLLRSSLDVLHAGLDLGAADVVRQFYE